MKIPVISISGNPYDLGFQHGRQAKKAIQENVLFYMNFWEYFGGANRDQILNDAQKFVPYIEKFDPEILEELKGVAEGSGLQFEEIVALNARYELSYAYMPPTPTWAIPGGCTSYALTPEATQNQHMFVGMNWDYKPGVENSCIILRINQKKKPDIITHTEAGIIAKIGFNSAGIGVVPNYIRCEKDSFRPGLPAWLKLRGILNAESLPVCIRMLMTFEGPNSVNMVIAHRDGEVIAVECTPDDEFFLYPERGILTHANYFQSLSLRVKDVSKAALPDAVIRTHRAFRLFQERRGNLGWDTIKDVLKDHFGYPNSICRHRDEGLHPYEQWETLTSVIIDLTEGQMLYTSGPPCSHPYESIAIERTT